MIEAVQCALDRGEGGRAYFLNDQEATTFREFVAMLAGRQGLSIEKVRSMSYRFAFMLGRLMEFSAAVSFSKNDPPLSRSLVRMIGRPATTSDAAARQELGYIGNISRAEGLETYSTQVDQCRSLSTGCTAFSGLGGR